MMQSMVIQMNDRQLQTLSHLQAFLDGTAAVDFAVAAEERYGFIGRTVRRFAYGRLKESNHFLGVSTAQWHQVGGHM
jgi:hypothetical protein